MRTFSISLLFLRSLTLLLVCHEVYPQYKTERPPYEDFLNYGTKKLKSTNKNLENEIIKSKVDVLGDVLKNHVNKLRKSPGQNVELVFLVDSSASVGAENFFNELKFVKKLLADFTVSYNQTRVAVITFSSKSKVIRHIDHVTQASPSNHKCSLLERELPRIGYTGGGTYTLGALMEAQSVLAISRKDAVKAVFLVTDGYSNGGDPRPAAEFLKSRGVIVFTFGIQNGNVKELHDMASYPREEHSYILNSFQEFEALARRALHEDLHSGKMISQDAAACSTLCDARDDCCDDFARCTCGTHTGHYACTCRIGYYGTGLKGDCRPCPAGTYRDVEGPSDVKSCRPCPDQNMLSPEGSTSPHQCYCNRGYTQTNLQCHRLKCPPLTPPPNGYFVRDTCERAVNAACGIRCRPSYSLEGSSIRLCREDGTWSGGDATCVMKTCTMLKAPTNGGMICSSETGTIDTQCHFTCKPGYQLVGSKMRTCLPVAMWDGIRAYCKPIFCPALAHIKYGIVKPGSCTVGKIKYGTRCEFGCGHGYQLSGPLKTICTDKGVWSEGSQKARCVDIEPPFLQCPRNQALPSEPNENYALVQWDPPVVIDSAKGKVYVSTIPTTKQPMRLKIGPHTMSYVAKDEWGNKAKCTFVVTVEDKEPPKIDRCESPPIFLSRDAEVDVYWEEPIFSDNSGGIVKVTRSREPGSFRQGETVVEYMAQDSVGNAALCNITIDVQQHACDLPLDPINGAANCTENPEAVYCTLTCQNGYAFAMRPNQDYFCAYDGIWQPNNNPLPFPDCSVSSISNTISYSGEMAMEGDDRSVCDDIFFMGQVENAIQQKLEDALRAVCADDDLCEISTVEAVCEGLLSEAEEEFNSIGFKRRKRDLSPHHESVRRFWDVDNASSKWIYWTRGSPTDSFLKIRTKRDTSASISSKKQFGFPSSMFPGREINETLAKKRNDDNANFMGVLVGLIVKSLGKDIGMTRLSTFLTSLGKNEGKFGIDDFLAAFSKEFGEEKAKDVRSLAEKRLGPFLNSGVDGKHLNNKISMEKGFHLSQSSFSQYGGTVQIFDREPNQQQSSFSSSSSSSMQLGHPIQMAQKSFDDAQADEASIAKSLENILDQNSLSDLQKRILKIKFEVEGHGDKASELISPAVRGLLQSASEGKFDIDFGEKQLKVSAIRLSEDPEYKCDPGSVLIDQLCVECPVGTYFNVILKECQSCPAGSYQPEEGQVSCLVCPENTSTRTGQAKSNADCKALCLPGSYSSDKLEPCTTCSIGEYQDEYASSACSACPFGTTTWRRGAWLIQECKRPCETGQVSETGLDPCLPCPMDYFQNQAGQKECLRCPDSSHTTAESSTSFYDCIGVAQNSQAAYTSFEKLPINDCFSAPCAKGATCRSMEFGYVCHCPVGYTGQHCETEINECSNQPCLNHATCHDELGYFTCECSPGFVGSLCDVNVDECDPNLCQNYATCVDLVNEFKCICEPGFTGEICDTNIDECQLAPCSEESTCQDGVSDYTCVCPPGFQGRHCREELNECDSAPCLHGTCADLVADFRCTCEPGYSGKQCGVNVDECHPNPCLNNATCTDWINGYQCQCPPGFTGLNCETKMSTDFVLEFRNSGIVNYATSTELLRPLEAATVCFWMKTKDNNNYGTPFSYATDDYDNALTLTDYAGFVFYVNGEKKITDVSANDGAWHMMCATWTAKEGSWSIVKDGVEVDSGKGLSEGQLIEADGVFVLGQEQDQRGGKYSAPESFIGELSLLNVWGRVLPVEETNQLYKKCSRYDGDIKSWPDFQSGIMGQVKLKSSTFCMGCGTPFVPPNSQVVEKGNVARVICDDGYKLHTGDGERICLVDGTWSGTEPKCSPVSCGFPGSMQNGKVQGFKYTFGGELQFVCNPGFRLTGSSARKCQANGKWSGEKSECHMIQCPTPTPMENGVLISHLNSYLPTNRVSFSCHQGYQMDGPSYQTCGRSGQWEGDAPACQLDACGDTPKISRGTVTKDSDNSGAMSAVLTCNSGYKVKGGERIACKEDGSWSKPLPKCVRAKCEQPPPIQNGNFKIRVSNEGKQAKYKCDAGFVVDGPSLITCTKEGEWDTPTFPTCIPQSCPTPEVPTFGVIEEKERWSTGDVLVYKCIPGYLLKGNPSKVCVQGYMEGYWAGTETPVCEPFMCQTLSTIKGGVYTVIQQGKDLYSTDSEYIGSEIELTRRRRSPQDFGFPSIGQSSNYDELEDFGEPLDSQIFFPGQSRSHSREGFDTSFGGQESQDEYFGQTQGGDDYMSQVSGGSDYENFDIGQTSNGFNDYSQSTDGLDVFSQTDDYDDISQSSSSGFDSQTPDSLNMYHYAYDTIVQYECRPGYKLIGSQNRRCSETGDWDHPEPQCYEQHCSELNSLPNGHLTYFGSGVSSKIEFHCDPGFRIEGTSEIVCQTDQTWSGDIPKCEPLNCEAPTEPENGTVTFTSTTFGSVANYDCFYGFVLEGSFERYCSADGFWNNSLPNCIEVTCAVPTVIDKGYISYEGNRNVDSFLEYGCHECYKLIGTEYRECQLNATWSLEEPRCELIICDAVPSELENGKVIGGDNSCGSLVEYECNPGYKLKGFRKASCMENAKWSSPTPVCERVSCGQPKRVKNAKTLGNSFKFSDQITYECNKGHVMNGNNVLTCNEKKKWEGSIPKCKIIYCSNPISPLNGHIQMTNVFYGSSAMVTCNPGYRLEGDKILKCKENGKWDKEMPFCSPLICPPAPQIKHSIYNSSELNFESFTYLKYECEEGFVTTLKDTILKCNYKGDWEGDFIDCKPVDCGKPNIKDGKVEGNIYTLGYVVNFTCYDGYKLIGEEKATCQKNRLWSSISSCKIINCGKPNLIPYGIITVDKPQGDFNTSIHYQCLEGYLLSGPSKLTCNENGIWSGVSPLCKPVLCPEPPEQLNAEKSGDIYEFKHNISYKCNEGAMMKGKSVLICREDGTWSSDFPVCDTIVCDNPEEVTNAKWATKKISDIPTRTEVMASYKKSGKKSKKGKHRSKTSKSSKMVSLLESQYEDILYRFGHIIEYTCDHGYFKTTSGVMECTSKGWNSVPPQCHPITCPLPIQIKNGRVYGDEVHFGSVLKYECNEGYDLFGVSERTCQANKEWTDIEPYCRPKECPRPARLINGKTIVESIKYQSVISYVCDPGFKLEGDTTRICQSDENWSGERPFCVETFCDDLREIPYGTKEITSLKVGGTARYSCGEGYEMKGKGALNCQSDGTWSGAPPKCVLVDCGPIPMRSQIVLIGDSTVYSSKIAYTCEKGYKLEGADWTSCLASGKWSNRAPKCNLVTCDVLASPEHGVMRGAHTDDDSEDLIGTEIELGGEEEEAEFAPLKRGKQNRKSKSKSKRRRKQASKAERLVTEKVYVVDDEVTFECEPGWKTKGEATLRCLQEGYWSSAPPKCERISCDSPEVPEHAKYTGQNFNYEGEVWFSCDKGYILRGNPIIKCDTNGNWSDNYPECEPMNCGSPPTLSNSQVTYTFAEHGLPHHYGSSVTYGCAEGHVLEGSVHMTCEASGKWIGDKETPVCVEMLCGDPPNVHRAISTKEENQRPQVATYTCEPGYRPSGNDSIYCSLGRWKGLNVTCNPVNCYEPIIPIHGKITAKHFTFGSIANYSCIEGHELKGNPSVECGVEGEWIGDVPHCPPVNCGKPETPQHGKVKFGSTIYNNEALYFCNDGHELKGIPKRTCTPDGSWSGHLPQCHRISCGELEPPSKGFVIGVGQRFSDEVKFTCEKGHVLIGIETSVCQADGTWSVTNPECEGVKCDSPPLITNGEPSLGGTVKSVFVYGDRVEYSCQKGHLPRGDLSSVCQKGGTWLHVRGQCSKISCGRPKVNKDGAVILGRSFYYNDKVRISCPSGTKPKGSSQLTCQSDGTWSGEATCSAGCGGKCLNGGVCLTDTICSCPTGFVGSRCQYALCPLPCLNGGVCTGPHRCTCLPGYAGTRCQKPVCEYNCGVYGKCIGPNVCLCQYGETAESCPEYDDYGDYDYYSQHDVTQFNDWDLAALRSKMGRNHNGQ